MVRNADNLAYEAVNHTGIRCHLWTLRMGTEKDGQIYTQHAVQFYELKTKERS